MFLLVYLEIMGFLKLFLLCLKQLIIFFESIQFCKDFKPLRFYLNAMLYVII